MAMLAGSYLLLQNSGVQTFIIQKITENLSSKTNARISVGKVDFEFFNKIVLNDVLVATSGNDTIVFSKVISAKIDSLSFRKKKISLGELSFYENRIKIARDTANRFNFSNIIDSLSTGEKDTTANWWFGCQQFSFNNSGIIFINQLPDSARHYFVDQLSLNISGFTNYADSTSFRINNLALHYKDIIINQLDADVKIKRDNIDIKALNMNTDKSEINGLNLKMQSGDNEKGLNKNMNFDVMLAKSTVNLAELGELIPTFHEIDETVEVSGRIYGNLSDIKGKDLILKTGNNTNAEFDFYINGIENIETMYLFLDLKQLETTVESINNFKIVSKGKRIQMHIPESFYNSGLLSFKGNFSGFLSDFVTFGTLKSKMGIIRTDVSVIPKKNGIYSYRGRVTTTDFELGNLLKTKDLGRITFNGNVDGDYRLSDKSISGLFKGEIAQVEAKKYIYKNIRLDGYYKDKMFDGMVSVNDSNLQLTFLGRWDASSETPNFDFNLHVDKLVPGKLNITGNEYQSDLAFNMKAKFSGNKIDNLKGVIIVDDGMYKNKNGSFSLNGIQLISVPQKNSMELSFNSNYFDIRINGNYHFQDIWNSLKGSINKFIPAANFKSSPNSKPNLFDYRIMFKNLDDVTTVFIPDLKVETPFFLYGKVDTDHSDFQLEGSVPGFQYKDFRVRNIFISNKIIDNQYVSKIKLGEIAHRSGISFYDFAVNSEISDNLLKNKIDWFANIDSTGYSSIRSYSNFSVSENSSHAKVLTSFMPSGIFLADTVWSLNPFKVSVDSSTIAINNFELFNKNQRIQIDGNISMDSTEMLFVNFRNIDLEYLEKNLTNSKTVKGITNGSLILSRVYKLPIIIADVKINKLEYQNQEIGDVLLSSNWDVTNSAITSELEIVKNRKKSLIVNGSFNPATKALNYNVKADSLPLKLLETVITEDFTNFTGTTTGTVVISGTPEKILLNGSTKVTNASLTIDYTQTKYLVDDNVYFMNDTIQFRNMSITDIYKNKGTLNGVLVHKNFTDIIYNLSINSPKIKVYSATAKHNSQFYGDVFANCKLKVLGQGLKVALSGSLTSLPGTSVNISMESENSIEQYDFLEFVNKTDTENRDMFFYNPPKSDFTISFNIELTPDAKLQLVYNSQIGDVIKGEGDGILLFEMNKYGDISLSGDYTVVKGDYLFTLQSVVSKKFTIAPGGTIVWSGNPYNAVINISAIYSLKTSLSDLMADNYNSANYLYQRIPVECVILLTDELINPTIKFKINFPEENEEVKNQLLQFFNTDEEMNKQILSLIVLGKFYTPEYMRGQYQSQNPNMISTTASELFSNQLSNLLSQISKNVDVGFKYRPGNSITKDELELALSTQIFSDRVSLNGNIGNNVNPESKNSSQIVGDFDMRVKITPNGKIQLKAYNHANNDLIYETAPYTQGVGFSFKEEYNTFEDLINKITSVFKKKAKN